MTWQLIFHKLFQNAYSWECELKQSGTILVKNLHLVNLIWQLADQFADGEKFFRGRAPSTLGIL